MSEATERLRRFLTEEENCCGEDVGDRLAELDDLEALASAHAPADVPVLGALANDTRYSLMRALVEADRDLCVCELRPLLSVSESAVSHALSELVDAGLATRYRDGKWRYYESTARAEALFGALDVTRPDGAPSKDPVRPVEGAE